MVGGYNVKGSCFFKKVILWYGLEMNNSASMATSSASLDIKNVKYFTRNRISGLTCISD